MRVIYIFLLFIVQFSSYEFDSRYLTPVSFRQSYTFNLNQYYSQNFIQIFCEFTTINVNAQSLYLSNVFQAGFIISKDNIITISSSNYDYVKVWYRVIDATDIINLFPKLTNLNFQINGTSTDSYLSLKFPNWIFTKYYAYQLWIVPIFPIGQFQSWSGDYSSRISSRIIPILNSSIDDNYLQNNAILLANISNSNVLRIDENILVNRNLYTYLIIFKIYINERVKFQINPAIIYGCLSKSAFSSTTSYYSKKFLDGTDSCKPNLTQVWFNITCAALAFIILFILCGYLSEKTQIFYSSWMISAYFSCVGYHYIIGNLFESNVYLYVILFAMGIGCAIAFTVIFSLSCKEGKSLRMFFNACCIILIILSIVFFCLENKFPKELYVYIGIGVISFVLLIFLLVCNGFTLTFGSTFIGITLMCLGFSLVAVDSSAIPLLFADFFNYILNRKLYVYYFSFFLKNDIIIFTFWAFLTLVIGISTYTSWRNKNSKKQKKTVDPLQTRNRGNYGATGSNIHVNIVTNRVENYHLPIQTTQLHNDNPMVTQPTAPLMELPPPYSR